MSVAVAIDRLIRRVGDIDRSAAFYRTIGFASAGIPTALEADLASALGLGRRSRSLTLAIGSQTLVLVTDRDAEPLGPGPAANDPAFQHLAIPVLDMEAAMAALEPLAPEPISRGGAQTLPASSGGVVAFKFRDPDGQALEFIHFPSGEAASRWSGAAGLFLGIDHTAITVSSVDRALGFFEDRLGFRLEGRGLNHGPEQGRLDGLADPIVDVLPLVPQGRPTPHLELLHYRAPAFATAKAPSAPATWTVLSASDEGAERAIRLDAPDGHGLVLIAPDR